MTSSNLSYLLESSISKLSHVRGQGLDMWTWGGHNSFPSCGLLFPTGLPRDLNLLYMHNFFRGYFCWEIFCGVFLSNHNVQRPWLLTERCAALFLPSFSVVWSTLKEIQWLLALPRVDTALQEKKKNRKGLPSPKKLKYTDLSKTTTYMLEALIFMAFWERIIFWKKPKAEFL